MNHPVSKRCERIWTHGSRIWRWTGVACYKSRDPIKERLCKAKCGGGGGRTLEDGLCGERKISYQVRGSSKSYHRLLQIGFLILLAEERRRDFRFSVYLGQTRRSDMSRWDRLLGLCWALIETFLYTARKTSIRGPVDKIVTETLRVVLRPI